MCSIILSLWLIHKHFILMPLDSLQLLIVSVGSWCQEMEGTFESFCVVLSLCCIGREEDVVLRMHGSQAFDWKGLNSGLGSLAVYSRSWFSNLWCTISSCIRWGWEQCLSHRMVERIKSESYPLWVWHVGGSHWLIKKQCALAHIHTHTYTHVPKREKAYPL